MFDFSLRRGSWLMQERFLECIDGDDGKTKENIYISQKYYFNHGDMYGG